MDFKSRLPATTILIGGVVPTICVAVPVRLTESIAARGPSPTTFPRPGFVPTSSFPAHPPSTSAPTSPIAIELQSRMALSFLSDRRETRIPLTALSQLSTGSRVHASRVGVKCAGAEAKRILRTGQALLAAQSVWPNHPPAACALFWGARRKMVPRRQSCPTQHAHESRCHNGGAAGEYRLNRIGERTLRDLST
jgi:hypothetical protein